MHYYVWAYLRLSEASLQISTLSSINRTTFLVCAQSYGVKATCNRLTGVRIGDILRTVNRMLLFSTETVYSDRTSSHLLSVTVQ